jgi:hypothetical protein
MFGTRKPGMTSFWVKATIVERPWKMLMKRYGKFWQKGKAIPIRELDCVTGYSGKRPESRSMHV